MEIQNQDGNTDHVVVIIKDENPKPKGPKQPTDEDLNPRVPAATRTLRGLTFSKPKSRFTEINHPILPPKSSISKSQQSQPLSPYDNFSSTDDDEDWYNNKEEEDKEAEDRSRSGKQKITPPTSSKRNSSKRKINRGGLIEWSLFLIIMTCLLFSLTLKSLNHKMKWDLKIWKWCLMVMVLFCGRLVSGWVVRLFVFFIERNFMLREKVLYFVYGLRKSFQNCVWLGLVLLAWMFMLPSVHKRNIVLKKVFRLLVAVLIAATIWLIKILLVEILASSFHVATFFDRMKESVLHHYVLEALSGPPLNEVQMEASRNRTLLASKSLRDLSSNSTKFGSRRIDMVMLKKLSMESTASPWKVKRLVTHVMSSSLSTISRTVDDFGKTESEITSEWEAKKCAQRIYKNVAKPGAKYIEEEDLLRFLKSEEVYTIFPHFEGATETGTITKSSFRNWVVEAYIERKALTHTLNDTKTAVHQLHKLASAIVIVIIIVVSLLVLGLATTKVVFLLTSQLLLVGFMFQNTCKTIFESIIFVFVMHPFDVGDRCVVDNVQMVVEEMNILTTVFLRYDMEKIYYPNTVLLTKPISNFRRSPDMGDIVDFTIDVATSVEAVSALKKAIQT